MYKENNKSGAGSNKSAYITRKIADEGMAILKDKLDIKSWTSEKVVPRSELLQKVVGVSGLLCTIGDTIDKEVLDAAGPSLEIISSLSSGTNHIDMQECKKRNITVLSLPDVTSDAAAEFTVTLVLLVARRMLEGMDAVVNGEWGLWKPMWICGFEMGGRTLGIYGFGRVGFGVARRLKPFKVGRIIYHDLYNKEYAADIAELVDLDTLLAESDILCICCAATPQTIKSFNREMFSKMKAGSILVNTARGAIVDHGALNEALVLGRPMAAGLDVTDPEPLPACHPLLKNPRCIITPHLSTATVSTSINMATAAAKNLMSIVGMDE